jgi:DNA-binding MarR family transcriptional regulator
MAEMVRRLVQKGLIERRRSKKDTRAYVIKLSHDGLRVLKGAEPLAKRVDDKVLHALGSRSGAFLDSLSMLAQRLEGATKA